MNKVCALCPYAVEVGQWVFHGHRNALTVAGLDNRRLGRKVYKVVVQDANHFRIVKTFKT